MGSVTPFLIAGEGYVRVEVNWQDFPHARKCWIYRRVAGQTDQVRLRDGNAVRLSNGIAVAFDHEAPLDTPVVYRSTIGLNYNGDFEEGVTEWTDTTNGGTVGLVAQSRDYYVSGEGLASLVLTPSGAATSKAVSEFIPATAGVSYTIQGRLMVPKYWAGGIGVQIQWYNGLTPLTTVGAANDLQPFPGVWGTYGFSATAPATTTQCKIVAAITGTPPAATMKLYVDEMYLTISGTTTVTSAATVTVPSSGGGWWTDPLHPATKVRLQIELDGIECRPSGGVVYLGVSDETFPADSSISEVNDAEWPIGTWNRRKSGRQGIRMATDQAADLAAVRALHASGAPLLLQINQAYGELDAYGLHGELAVGRIATDQRIRWRVVAAQFVKVAGPVGPPEGTLKTRYMDLTRYSTFALATAAGVTWLDGLQAELTI